MASISLTQITDLHLGDHSEFRLGGVPTLASFEAVLRAVEEQGRGADRLLLTGDLASDCQPHAYQQLNRILRHQQKQAIWLPGNHDDPALMREHLVDYPPTPYVELGCWGILTLDSSVPDQPGGHIAEVQLQQVQQSLKALEDKFILVAMHHSPVPVGCAWLDRQQIDNQQQLYQLLQSQSNIKAVVTGHVHQQFEGYWGNLPIYCTPSSCVQFKQQSFDFALSEQPPAYRWFNLHDDGSLETDVTFVENFTPRPDPNSASY
jgi:Icc protein